MCGAKMDVPISSHSPVGLLSGNHWEVHRFRFILLPEPGYPQPPLHTGCREQPRACPKQGAAAVGVLGQQMHLCPYSLAKEALPRGDPEGRHASCSTEEEFSFSREVSSACQKDILQRLTTWVWWYFHFQAARSALISTASTFYS